MKNWTNAYLTNMMRGSIVRIDISKNGDSAHMPEDKNRPHLYDPLLAMMPDALVMPNPPYGGTFRVAADAKLQQAGAAAIGRIALVDFEHGTGKASLREHLPRALGTVVSHFGTQVDVRMGCDPYAELRSAMKNFRRTRDVLEAQQRELSNELSEALQKLDDERKKRIVDVQAREAAEKRVKVLEEKLCPMKYRSYSLPSWSSLRAYSSFPTIMGVDPGSKPIVALGTFIHEEFIADYVKLETQAMSKLLSDWYKVAAPKPAPKEPQAPEPDMWTTGDGSRIEVAKMTDAHAHLHFAIAKAYRMEYPDQRCRQLGVQALKREAARRLQGYGGPPAARTPEHMKEVAQLKNEVAYERDRRLQMGQTNARLNVELDALKSQVAQVWKDPNQEAKIAALHAEIERLRESGNQRVAEVSKMYCNANELALKERQAAETACAETMKLRGQVNKLRANLDATQKVAGQLQERLTIIRDATH